MKVVRLNFKLIEIRDEKGVSIYERLVFKDLIQIQNEICAEQAVKEMLTKYPDTRMPLFFIKQFFSANLSEESLARIVYMIQVVAWKNKKFRGKVESTQFFVNNRPWLKEIKHYAMEYGVELLSVKSYKLSLKQIFRWLLKENLTLLRNIYYGGISRWLKWLRNKSLQGTLKLLVEYAGNLNLEKPELYSDLFFWQMSNIPANQLLVSFITPADPLDSKKLSELNKFGIESVALDPRAVQGEIAPVFYPSWQWPKFGDKIKLLFYNHEKRYIKQIEDDYRVSYNYWHEFLKSFKVKIFISWYKHDSKHAVVADALQNLGGITAIYQRSSEDFPSPRVAVSADVVFGFSNYSAEVMRLSGSSVPYFIITGYIGDHRFALSRESSIKLRQKLSAAGAKKIVAFFDESSLADERWHPGHKFLQDNYIFLLEKVLSEPWLGLIIKSKHPSTLKRRLGPIAEVLNRAEQTGRCFVAEGGVLHNAIPPALAALAADVVIHGHLCAVTAGFEAALTGTRTVFLDREGWPDSFFYKVGKNRLVFSSWDELWDSCGRYFENSSSVPGFGDWSNIIDKFDPFRDGRAAERMGTFLQWLTEGFEAGLSRDRNLAVAAEKYAERWGADKVIEIK